LEGFTRVLWSMDSCLWNILRSVVKTVSSICHLASVTPCHSPVAVGALILVLGAWAVNNNTNSGLCQAAMA
jgi:hypothetical protein